MRIETLRHKGLRQLYERDDPGGVPASSVSKLKNILTALEFAADLSQVATMPGWRLHPLRGNRRGTYAIRVTGNVRLTFRVRDEGVTDLDLEDYH